MPNKIQIKRSSVAGKAPTTSDIDLGELAINTYDGKLFLKKNVSGVQTIVEVTRPTRRTLTATATAGQTTFSISGGYAAGYIDVFMNGAKLMPSDLTATDGTSVILSTSANAGDELEFIVWG